MQHSVCSSAEGIIIRVNQDPRFLRSQERLHNALLEIAVQQAPEFITVTALANAAEVHRSTVYEHADSIQQLLHQAITAELTKLTAGIPTGGSSSLRLSDEMKRVLTYVETRPQLFQRMTEPSGVVIAEALSSFISGLMHDAAPKFDHTHLDSTSFDHDTVTRITVRAAADAMVRVIAEWIMQPASRTQHEALQVIDHVLPAWWGQLTD